MAQMAIEGGCGWLILGDNIDAAERREHYPAIVEMCRQAGVMLSATADIAVVKEYGLHGIYLPYCNTAVQLRTELGPEAVIGTAVDNASQAIELEKADIDYVTLPPVEASSSVIEAIAQAGGKIPVVAYVDTSERDHIDHIRAMGFSGICCGKQLFEADDPVREIESLIAYLQQ